MRYCSLCKNLKEEVYCVFCEKKTKNDYVLKVSTMVVKCRFHLLKMTHRRPGFKRFLSRVCTGWQETRGKDFNKYPEGVNKYMLIDKENNRYIEHITDCKTGEVIKDKNESLSNHVPESQQK